MKIYFTMLLMRGAVFLLVSSLFLFVGSVKGMDGLLNLILSIFFNLSKYIQLAKFVYKIYHLCHATPPELKPFINFVIIFT